MDIQFALLDEVAKGVATRPCTCTVYKSETFASTVHLCDRCELILAHEDWKKTREATP